MTLVAAVPVKIHMMNLLHRLIHGTVKGGSLLATPSALPLRREAKANVERYDESGRLLVARVNAQVV